MSVSLRIRRSDLPLRAAVRLLLSPTPKPIEFIACALCAVVTLGVVASAYAGGGMGSVWVTSHTSTTIDIGWSDPDGIDYRYCGGDIKICYKELDDGVPEAACGNGGYTLITPITPAHFITISGLSPSTRYKFKVYVKAEKLNLFNNWKNCEWRKVGTLKQETDAPPAAAHIDNLAVTGTGQFTIVATVTSNHSGDYDMIRVGYKRTWTHWLLNNTIKQRDDPESEWGERDPRRGWIDMPAAPVVSFEIDSLAACRQYKLVAYGFRPGVQLGELLGEANGRTGASCKTFDISALVIDNHEDVLESYANALHALYCSALPSQRKLSGQVALDGCDTTVVFNHVVIDHPELYDDYLAMIDEGDRLSGDYETIEYLEQRDGEVYDEWQGELFAVEMDLPQYVQREYPAVYAALLGETTAAEVPMSRWASLMVASFIVVLGGVLLGRRG